MEGRLYLRLLIRNRILIAVVTLLGVLGGVVLYEVASPTYRSNLTFSVQSDAGTSEPSEVYQAELLSQARAQTYARLVSGPGLADRLQKRIDPPVSTARVQGDLTAEAAPTSVLLHITVTDHSAATVNGIAAALVAEFPAYIADLQPFGTRRVTTVQVAEPPRAAAQIAPTKTRYVGLGLLAGLLLSLLLAVIRETSNRRLRDVDDVRSVVGPAPVVVRPRGRSRLGRNRRADPAALLSIPVTRAAIDRKAVVLVPVGSPRTAAAAAIELGRRLSAQGDRVVLIDADIYGRQVTSAAADWGDEIAVYDLAAMSGERHLPTTGPLLLVPAEAVEGVAAGSSHARDPREVDNEVVDAAVSKTIDRFRQDGYIVLVAIGGVLGRNRPIFLTAEPAEAVIVAGSSSTKSELRIAVSVLEQLGCGVAAVLLMASAPPRRGR